MNHQSWVDSSEATEQQSITSEVRLFRHIILNAVLDAVYGGAGSCDSNDHIRVEAWRWFFHAGPDFRMVCECADFNPEIVRRAALSYIAEARTVLPDNARRPRLHPMPRKKAA